jgi:hypothetical protein
LIEQEEIPSDRPKCQKWKEGMPICEIEGCSHVGDMYDYGLFECPCHFLYEMKES